MWEIVQIIDGKSEWYPTDNNLKVLLVKSHGQQIMIVIVCVVRGGGRTISGLLPARF